LTKDEWLGREWEAEEGALGQIQAYVALHMDLDRKEGQLNANLKKTNTGIQRLSTS
jgi:hypothetical protein